MALSIRRRPRAHDSGPGVVGSARVDRRTKTLTKRLQPGDIAVIDHADLDKVSADALVARASGGGGQRQRLDQRSLPEPRPADPRRRRHPGARRRRHGGHGPRGRASRSGSTAPTCGRARPRWPRARSLDAEAGRRRRCTRREPGSPCRSRRSRPTRWSTSARSAPCCSTASACRRSRPSSTVGTASSSCAATTTARTSRRCAPTSASTGPILIGVDGGADALLESGHQPDLIVGDMDSVSDKALRCGAEIVVHAYRDGRAPGLARVEALGIDAGRLPRRGHERGRRDAPRRRLRRRAHRRRRHPRHPGRVPRQGPRRAGLDLPDPPARRRQARRRQGRQPALPRPDPGPPARDDARSSGCSPSFAALASTPAGQAWLQVLAARWDDLWTAIVGIFT